MDKYVITLSGQGDTYVFFVDEEVWNWIHDRSLPMPQSVRDGIIKECRTDSICGYGPEVTDDEIIEDHQDTDGSWENDRALRAHIAFNDAIHDSVGAAMNWASENGVKVKESYEGYIY
jgi:hypothetical protein